MIFLFLMDKLEEVIRHKDTSYIFMLEAYERGHEVYYLSNNGISVYNNQLHFHTQKVKPLRINDKKPFDIEQEIHLSEKQVDAVFIRTNPPFDENYLTNTWLLSLLNDRTFCMNNPKGIREVNEKVWVNRFPQWTPKTIITQDQKIFTDFLQQEKKIIIKPLDGFGGKGVFIINKNDTNAQVAFETLSQNSTKKIIIQQYIKEAQDGDKRILLLNGEILGAVLRVHRDQDHRNNFFAGGQAIACTITNYEKDIIKALQPYLKQLGLYFVGLDFLGSKLTEINVTSPTCLQEMNRLYNKKLQKKIIDFVEGKIKQCKN